MQNDVFCITNVFVTELPASGFYKYVSGCEEV
jgi:hypothetical protein